MNLTIWNSTEEVVASFTLAVATILIHSYAIFLCFAIWDYQEEKPKTEKCPTDVLIKDIKNVEFWILYFSALFHFISLFVPPHTMSPSITSFVDCTFTFLINLYSASWLVYLYIQYVFVFQNEEFENVNESSMRWKSLCWKLFITLLSILLSSVIPVPTKYFTTPLSSLLKMLSKGGNYERLIGNGIGLLLTIFGNLAFCLVFHCNLRSIEDGQLTRKVKILKYLLYPLSIFGFFVAIFLFHLMFDHLSEEANIYLCRIIGLVTITCVFIFIPKCYINQDYILKFYVSVYHHQPPPVLPWQLPQNFDHNSVKLNCVSPKNE